MYYRLAMDPVLDNVFVERQSHPFVMMIDGNPLPSDTSVPFEFSIDVDRDEEGNLEEARMFAFNTEPCLMHVRLLEVLRSVGVDNIQAFPAILRDSSTGQEYADYVAANIIGLVSCANIASSSSSPLAGGRFFHKLVIDPDRAEGLLLFRLAESKSDVIIHEKVARAIRAAGFNEIVLEELEEAPVT
jgi:hypothetical protein